MIFEVLLLDLDHYKDACSEESCSNILICKDYFLRNLDLCMLQPYHYLHTNNLVLGCSIAEMSFHHCTRECNHMNKVDIEKAANYNSLDLVLNTYLLLC